MGGDHPKLLAAKMELEWIENDDQFNLNSDLIGQLPHQFARQKMIIPLAKRLDGGCDVLIADPLDIEGIEMARFFLKCPIHLKVAPRSLILRGLDSFSSQREKKNEQSPLADEDDQSDQELGLLKSSAKKMGAENSSSGPNAGNRSTFDPYPINFLRLDDRSSTDELSAILLQAIVQRASDIHFEPFKDRWRVRYRIDGLLRVRAWHSTRLQKTLNTRIKVLAGLDIAESRRSQDGQLQVFFNQRSIDIRISIISVAGGERIALRLLTQDPLDLQLSALSMPPSIDGAFRTELKRSQGLILVCGPTGSGKTTTLYSALGEIKSDRQNIMTIEDPIEYHLPGISQMQVQPLLGIDFANGLHHLLRQDPDVLLVGEMRDAKAAEIAFRAALTGHLVLSTLHAKSAKGALMRIIELGIEPQLIKNCLNGILFQRLVRRRCPHCTSNSKTMTCLTGNKPGQESNCKHCDQTGYFGRRGVFEWLPMTLELRESIFEKNSQSHEQLAGLMSRDYRNFISLQDHVTHLINGGKCCHQELLDLL